MFESLQLPEEITRLLEQMAQEEFKKVQAVNQDLVDLAKEKMKKEPEAVFDHLMGLATAVFLTHGNDVMGLVTRYAQAIFTIAELQRMYSDGLEKSSS
jgi:hypothetical protein